MSGPIARSVIVDALGLPTDTVIELRVPKKLLVENGARTPADKRYIREGVEQIQWLAVLKPNVVGVPAHRDSVREYLEIAVLSLSLRPGAKMGRLIELVHRAIPYPVLLISEGNEALGISAGHIRWSQGEAGKTVLDDTVVTIMLDNEHDAAHWPAFSEALALRNLPHQSMYALYQGWIDALLTLQTSRLTGTFSLAPSPEHAEQRRRALEDCARLETRMLALRSAGEKESQTPAQVEINLELQRLKAEYAAARARL